MYQLIGVIVLSIVVIAVMFVQNRSNSKKLEDEINKLKEELEEKKALEIALAEAKKDEEAYKKEINELKNTLNEYSTKIDELQKNIKNAEQERFDLQNSLKELEYKQNSILEEKETLSKQISNKNQQISELEEKIENLRDENLKLNSLNSKLKANLEAQEENHKKLEESFGEQVKKFELKVDNIMQQALDSKLKKFDETSIKSIYETLKPFKENLEQFRKKVDDTQELSTKKFAELSKEIEQITKAGMHISQEAKNLTEALKGQKQAQGSWGEMILETVLEYSGLLKGVHFDTQQSYKDESGNIKRPDVVIHLPQNRSIIIDSKVSLNDYNRYIKAETDEERAVAAKNVVKAFRNQIDNLASKDYSHYKIGTLQYVFMFVPIEGAFSLAVQEDPTLYEYALKKHIVIVNPSTLTVSLHTIYLYWQSEQSNTLAVKLFNEAGKLYDKMCTFTDNFVKIGSQLQTVQRTYDTATKQLSEGHGNLLGRVENLKKLGAKTTKSLKDTKIEYQDFNDEDVEVEIIDEDKLQIGDVKVEE